ncbi:MAG: DUF3622 domain-containing protein [Methylococcales bacterium]|jgi:hypothetical protein|nr:DUF3622 domain-containing protein [Methylococcales bacterium]MBT7442356.1 DUF3622 domain-containing protein [Methylococcales bacterium]
MSKGKKYDFKVEQIDSEWVASIIRKVTSKKTTVSKKQTGFASEADATTWAETEVQTFLKNLQKHNQQHSEHRKQKAERKAAKAAKTEETE